MRQERADWHIGEGGGIGYKLHSRDGSELAEPTWSSERSSGRTARGEDGKAWTRRSGGVSAGYVRLFGCRKRN